MTVQYLKKIVSKLPVKPGVYFFRALGGKNIYIGKAAWLRNRVLNYTKTEDSRIQKMIETAKSLKFITTDSDIEALILESQYIKKYRPIFNVVMRDDKQYGFVAFTKEAYPKIYVTHQPNKPAYKLTGLQADFIGPFTDIGALKTTLQYLRNIFLYCTCKQLHNNYCLNYHIGKCPGFCCLKQRNRDKGQETRDKLLYRKNIKAIKNILSGNKNSLIKISALTK